MSLADVVFVGVRADRLLLRAADEPDGCAPASWPAALGPVVACTPRISGRPDLFPVLREVLPDLLGGCAYPVRLLLSGTNASSNHWSDELQLLTDHLGMPIVLEPPDASPDASEPASSLPTVDTGADRAPPAIGAVGLLAPRRWDQPTGVTAAVAAIPEPVLPEPISPSPADPPPADALADTLADALAGADAGPAVPRSDAPPAATPPAADGRSVTAVRLDPADLADDDWPALRLGLDGSYDAHARVVARALSEQPGLRGTGAQPAGGLVAVRAICSEQGEPTRRVLRGPMAAGDGSLAAATGPALLVARAAGQGLRRLPTVLGPVFRPARATPEQLAAYRPGSELFEPGFVDADLAPSQPPGTTLQFVIWSFNGRRVDALAPADARPVLFPPGTVFGVLEIDRPDGEPVRVLVRERGVGGRDEPILAGLRAAASTAFTDTGTLDGVAIGLDDDGGHFRPGP